MRIVHTIIKRREDGLVYLQTIVNGVKKSFWARPVGGEPLTLTRFWSPLEQAYWAGNARVEVDLRDPETLRVYWGRDKVVLHFRDSGQADKYRKWVGYWNKHGEAGDGKGLGIKHENRTLG